MLWLQSYTQHSRWGWTSVVQSGVGQSPSSVGSPMPDVPSWLSGHCWLTFNFFWPVPPGPFPQCCSPASCSLACIHVQGCPSCRSQYLPLLNLIGLVITHLSNCQDVSQSLRKSTSPNLVPLSWLHLSHASKSWIKMLKKTGLRIQFN